MAANDPGQPPLSTAPDRGIHASDWSTDLAVPGSALAIGAHPDDVEFGAGGTLAKWAAAGCIVHHLVCTDGSKGTWNPSATLSELVARRAAEQREAAHRLAGRQAGKVVFLGRVDGELDSDRTTRGDVVRVLRELRPDVVLGHDPWKRYRLHPDHRYAGLLACDAVVAARDPHFHPEQGLRPHRPSALLLWEADEPNHVEDVTSTVERKLHALEAHRSQFESTMNVAEDEQLTAFRMRIRTRLAELGARHGFAAAEVFALITDL